MDVRLPDGTIIRNVPEGTTKAQLLAKLEAHKQVKPNAAEGFKTNLNIAGFDTGIELPESVSQGLAGVGSGMMDLVQGAKQRLGMASEAETAEKRKLDKDLMATTPGMIGNIAGQAAPIIAASALMPGAPTFLGQVGAGAGYGALQGALTPTAQDESALMNTLAGAGIGGITGGATKLATNVITPSKGLQNKELLSKAERLGLKIRIGDKLESVNLKNIDDVLRFLPTTAGKELALDEGNIKILNKTLAKAMGTNLNEVEKAGGKLTREVVDETSERLGRKFSMMASRTTIDTAKPEFRQSLTSAVNKTQRIAPQVAEGFGEVKKWFSVMDDWLAKGTIDGKTYQANRSILARKVRDLYRSGDSAQAGILDDILGAMDSAAPDTKGWQELRKQYSVYKMVEKNQHLISDLGDVRPKQLERGLYGANKKMFTQGKFGELGDAAQVASAYLKDPNSATAMRSFWQRVLTNPIYLGGAAGAVGGLHEGGWDPSRAALAGGLGLLTPTLAQSFMRSNLGQQYLTHGLLGSAGNVVNPILQSSIPPLTVSNYLQE